MRVLLAGLGSIGQRHARNLRACFGDAVTLSAYRVRGLTHVISPSLAIEPDVDAATRYGLTVYRDLSSALAARPDVVFVTNPNSCHMPVAMAAAEAGCHLFIEKPVSHTLDHVEALADLVDQKGRVGFVGYQMRFHPAFRLVEERLRQGAIGPLLMIRVRFGEYLPGWHPYEDYRETPPARRALGGGVLLSQIHDLDCIYALAGVPARVFAVGGHWTSLDVDVEDVASMLMECRVDGRAVAVHVQQDFIQRPATRTYEFFGESGRVNMDLIASTVRVFGADGSLVEDRSFHGFERNTLFLDELKHFMACVRGEDRPLVTIRDGLQSLRMALAARESLETGAVVAPS